MSDTGPQTAAGKALVTEDVGGGWVEMPVDALTEVVRAIEAEAAKEARTAALGAVSVARRMMQARYDDLRWCNKDDDCHVKAEGALLAIQDFDEAIRDAEAGADGSEGGTRT